MSVIAFPPQPLDRFDDLQRDELYTAQAVADYAAQCCGDGSIDRKTPQQKGDWIYRTTAYLRSRFRVWRFRATEHAIEAALLSMQAGELGATFSTLPVKKQRALARGLALTVIGSYTSVLEGTAAMGPSDYLRLRSEASQETR